MKIENCKYKSQLLSDNLQFFTKSNRWGIVWCVFVACSTSHSQERAVSFKNVNLLESLIYNQRVTLANRLLLALLSYWCQTAPLPSVPIEAPLKNTVFMTRPARPACKCILCIYQGILPIDS